MIRTYGAGVTIKTRVAVPIFSKAKVIRQNIKKIQTKFQIRTQILRQIQITPTHPILIIRQLKVRQRKVKLHQAIQTSQVCMDFQDIRWAKNQIQVQIKNQIRINQAYKDTQIPVQKQ